MARLSERQTNLLLATATEWRALALGSRGWAYKDKGGYDRAIVDYDKAIKINPDYVIAYRSRGLAYEDKGDLDQAISDYDEAIRAKALGE